MKTLCAALFLVLLAIIGAFYALPLLGLNETITGTIATSLVAGFPKIREELDKQLAARTPQGIRVLSLSGFGLPVPRLVLYGSLILFATMNLSAFFAGITAAALGAAPDKLPIAITVISLLVVWPAVFLIGRWVGRRSDVHGLLAVFLIALVGRTGATLFDFAMNAGDDILTALYGNGSMIALKLAVGVAVIFAIGALGYWRGTRQRLGCYLGYLLRNVPDASQHAIVDLAFEEAGRVAGSNAPVRQASGNAPRAMAA
jgi:hypothetical protein